MAIRRISDLSSILMDTKTDVYHILSIPEGIKRDVLGGENSRKENGRETAQLKESLFEISWLKDGTHTKYNSQNISYETLCAYITHNIQCEDYDFYGTKNISGDVNITGDVNTEGDVNVTGDINIEGDNFSGYSKNVSLSGEQVNISCDTVYVKGHNTIDLVYNNRMTIYWNNNGNLIPAMEFGNNGTAPTIWTYTDSDV